jgi:hypothetical protein
VKGAVIADQQIGPEAKVRLPIDKDFIKFQIRYYCPSSVDNGHDFGVGANAYYKNGSEFSVFAPGKDYFTLSNSDEWITKTFTLDMTNIRSGGGVTYSPIFGYNGDGATSDTNEVFLNWVQVQDL